MIDGELYGPILFAFGVLIVGIGAFLTTITRTGDFGIFFGIGIIVVFLGMILHMSSDLYYVYKNKRK